MRGLVLLGLCVACADAPRMPPAITVAAHVVAHAVHEGDLYWVEVGDGVVEIHRRSAAESSVFWQTELGPYRGWSLVAGPQGVVIGESDTFENCGRTTLIAPDGVARVLPLIEDGVTCRADPIDQHAGTLLFGVSAATTRQVRHYDLSTGAIAIAFDLEGGLYSIVHTADFVYALATSDSETSAARFPRERPTSLATLARGIRDGAGVAVADDAVYWVDNGAMREAATVLATTHDGGEPPREVVRLDEDSVRGVAWLAGALWLGVPSEQALLRVEPTGEVTRFDVPYTAMQLSVVGDMLVIRTFETDDSRRLLVQPLP